MMKLVDNGILIHKSPYSSSSLLTTFYTEKNGLQKFIFKGGKKKAHGLFPLADLELTFYGRNSELFNLTSAEPISPFTFQFDPIKSTLAFFFAEVTLKCVLMNDPDVQLYDLLKKYANAMNENDEIQLFPISFLIELSDLLGILPLRNEASARVFNIDTGNFQQSLSKELRTFEGPAIDLLIQIIDKKRLTSIPHREIRNEALRIYLNYFAIHIPKFQELKSYEILKEVLND